MIPLLGLIIGLIVGLLLKVQLPPSLNVHVAIAVLSALTSLVHAMADILENVYRQQYVLISFLGNTVMAIVIAALGQQLDIPLSYVAYFAFGNALFKNLNRIWRQLVIMREEKKR